MGRYLRNLTKQSHAEEHDWLFARCVIYYEIIRNLNNDTLVGQIGTFSTLYEQCQRDFTNYSRYLVLSIGANIDDWIGYTSQGLGKVVANENLYHPPSRYLPGRDWR